MIGTPASILVTPGSFCPPYLYSPVRDAVAARGIDIRVLALPTVSLGSNDTRTPPSMYEDAAMIAREVELIADEGKDVIVVAHSYSGIALTEAAKGLGKESRKQKGKIGGLIQLAYLTAFAPELNESAQEIRAKSSPDVEISFGVDEKGWFYISDFESMADAVYAELPRPEALEWAKRFSNHSAQSFADKVTQLGYLDEDLAVAYLLHENDRLVTPSFQRQMIKSVEELSGKAVSVTNISAGHMSVVTAPNLVVDWIVKLAHGNATSRHGY